ncbi:exopolysaccharide biosynthesis polyprenyl glycosylphosphotransferase [Acidocella facilis]|uniref:exopolysaccharide biosynthesis polyprenyl glycosylphosphotransferase n=1 Tax=Acidocella facilis TaxID=525 RepID=UPI00068ABB1B|nr:exopolysaccharide biosynthesis polyprenyl glycosylphosphotransferase [Acidocella facilis]
MVEYRDGYGTRVALTDRLTALVRRFVAEPRSAYLLPIADFFIILLVPGATRALGEANGDMLHYAGLWGTLALLSVSLAASHRCFELRASWHGGVVVAISYVATSSAALAFAAFFDHSAVLTGYWTVLDLAITPLLLLGCHLLLKTAQPSRQVSEGVFVVCHDHCPADLELALAQQEQPKRILGVLYLAELREQSHWPEFRDRDDFIARCASQRRRDVVFVHHSDFDAFEDAAFSTLLREILSFPVRIWLAFDVSLNIPTCLRGESGSCRIVPVLTDDLVTSNDWTKRCFDIVVSTLLLILFVPILAGIACLVSVSGPGPIIFRQSRIGAQGLPFTVFKFRTMRHVRNACFSQAVAGDLRITKIGRFLRRTSLDELLQLINVLKGDMSLVGPRPHAPETMVEGISFEQALKLYKIRHRVKPGITGLAQIRGQRGETGKLSALEGRLSSDLEYIRAWSLMLDIKILFQTLQVPFRPHNAV